MTTKEQHAEIAIAVLDHIARADGIDTYDREELGLEPKGDACLLCHIYGHGGLNVCHTGHCPGSTLCYRYEGNNMSREEWVNAFRYHAGRA
jgi:hypothetical protein